MTFSDVKVLIWDFDGTFFRPIHGLMNDIMESDYKVVMVHNGWSREKTVAEFNKLYKVVTPSSTEVAAMLSHISVVEAAIECEQYKDRTKYLSRDEKLIDMFARLTSFTHYMLVNGIQEKVVESLKVLGIDPSQFVEIVTSEIVGVNKPNPQGFEYIMGRTGFPASAHMMIGDRELVDIAPAKKLGMHTCLVWSEKKNELADVTLPTVYDIPTLFT